MIPSGNDRVVRKVESRRCQTVGISGFVGPRRESVRTEISEFRCRCLRNVVSRLCPTPLVISSPCASLDERRTAALVTPDLCLEQRRPGAWEVA